MTRVCIDHQLLSCSGFSSTGSADVWFFAVFHQSINIVRGAALTIGGLSGRERGNFQQVTRTILEKIDATEDAKHSYRCGGVLLHFACKRGVRGVG